MANPFWPLFELSVRTPRLELRHPTDEMCAALAEAASLEMFPGGDVHFLMDWISRPSPARQRESMQWWWKQRAEFSVNNWSLTLAVVVDGEPVGVQDVAAKSFPQLRSVHTGSWLAAAQQGTGLGKEMRQAVLHLAFAGLGAEEALSEAFETNDRSIRVSRAVGYRENGFHFDLRAGKSPTRVIGFRMTKEDFACHRRDDITIENLEPCLGMFGLGPDLQPLEPPEATTPP